MSLAVATTCISHNSHSIEDKNPFKPSINCNGNLNEVEKMICNSEVLSVLDQALSLSYNIGIMDSKHESTVKNEQIAWLNNRNKSFNERLKNLSSKDSRKNPSITDLIREDLILDYDNRISQLVSQKNINNQLLKEILPTILKTSSKQNLYKIYLFKKIILAKLNNKDLKCMEFNDDNRYSFCTEDAMDILHAAKIEKIDKNTYLVLLTYTRGNALGDYLFVRLKQLKDDYNVRMLWLNGPSIKDYDSETDDYDVEKVPLIHMKNGYRWNEKTKTLTIWDNLDIEYQYVYINDEMLLK